MNAKQRRNARRNGQPVKYYKAVINATGPDSNIIDEATNKSIKKDSLFNRLKNKIKGA